MRRCRGTDGISHENRGGNEKSKKSDRYILNVKGMVGHVTELLVRNVLSDEERK